MHRRGHNVDHVFFLHGGMVMLAGSLQNCTMRDIAVVGREGIVGAFSAIARVPAVSDAQVHIGGSASRIPADAFAAAMDASPTMRRTASRCEAATMVQAQQSVLCNGAHSVEARICRWLLEIADRCDGERLPLTQSELAAMLGVRRTTITLVAGKLQMQGAIRCRRGHVEISDRDMLEHGSCECYGQVRDYVADLFRIPEGRATLVPSETTAEVHVAS